MLFDSAVGSAREMLVLMMLLSAPILGAALIIGLTVSLFQAVTQIQEQTLSFVPKILGMGAVAVIAMPWMVTKIMDFSAEMFGPFMSG